MALKKLWPVRSCVLITDDTKYIELIARTLKVLDWNISDVTDNPEQAIEYVYQKKLTLIIIDDTKTLEAVVTLRVLMNHPLAYITPILIFLSDRAKMEDPFLRDLLPLEIAEYPIKQEKLLKSLTSLQVKWQEKPLLMMRKFAFSYPGHKKDEVEHGFMKLKSFPEISSHMLVCLVILMLERGEVKEAEQMLLEDIKSKQSLIAQYYLVVIYMQNCMPYYAAKVIFQILSRFKKSRILYLDLIQAEILLNNFLGVLDHIEMFKLSFSAIEETSVVEARIKVVLNDFNKAKTILRDFPEQMLNLRNEWKDKLEKPL